MGINGNRKKDAAANSPKRLFIFLFVKNEAYQRVPAYDSDKRILIKEE
ncbi:MAG: hypothetical protein LIP16_14835 [Clostridium sp.]|nr:hypothetical protein [Clostridium sp.]